ncbi:MAG: 1-aminocyclopropane-1-carboxylate deaminase/D-cysteine desulfhydrase [Bacteroidota bacterium]|nr:1-aminocyclopropane-1-carboxylate deaminase/D-cysteine desulfhydrase [Bacteroidota bacterium]
MPQSIMQDIIPKIALNTPFISILKDRLYQHKEVEVAMLRLDEIHPVISGNKLFKLYYFLKEAKDATHKKIITFGGAYSNHLAATAFACNKCDIQSIGFVRGERSKVLSHTLSFCIENGMQLEFLSRSSYQNINDSNFLQTLKKKYGEHILIPEGGFSKKGAKGAELITQYFKDTYYSHICLATGTATTFAGIINSAENEYEIIGFCILKSNNDTEDRLNKLQANTSGKYSINNDYHFGGYAKKTNDLIAFINAFYDQHKIPLDFVYTGKMMFGVNDLIQKNYFLTGSKILCIHTGGLQGNNSLPKGILNF